MKLVSDGYQGDYINRCIHGWECECGLQNGNGVKSDVSSIQRWWWVRGFFGWCNLWGLEKKNWKKKSVSFYGKIGRHLGERTVEVRSLVGFYLVESFGHFWISLNWVVMILVG